MKLVTIAAAAVSLSAAALAGPAREAPENDRAKTRNLVETASEAGSFSTLAGHPLFVAFEGGVVRAGTGAWRCSTSNRPR